MFISVALSLFKTKILVLLVLKSEVQLLVAFVSSRSKVMLLFLK